MSEAEDKKHAGGAEREPDFQPPEPVRNRKPLFLIVAGVVLIAACVFVFFNFLTPTAKVKRAFNAGISAFEQKNIDGVLNFASEDYYDNIGNTRETIEAVLPAVFNNYDRIKVKIRKLEIEFATPDTATLTIEGTIFFKKGNETYPMRTSEPIELLLEREPGGWKLLTIDRVDFRLEDLEGEMP